MSLEKTISKLLEQRPIPVDAIVNELGLAAQRHDPAELSVIEWVSQLSKMFDEVLALPALAMSPAWGVPGVRVVLRHALEGPYNAYALRILGSLCRGRPAQSSDVLIPGRGCDQFLNYPLSQEMIAETAKLTREAMLDAIGDPRQKRSLLFSIASIGMISDPGGRNFAFFLDLLVDSHLMVNHAILSEFQRLLDGGPTREEELQRFLTKHPVLLDPFVTELRSKHELGSDFITDYVVRRINNEYVIIEIENSTDKIFTQDGQFGSRLIKAISQVRDFQTWIAENIAYAQKKLPSIRRPEGLGIIGRSPELNEMNAKRLEEENYSRRGHVRIVTYDDLLRQAHAVHRNLVESPLVLRARDQRTL